MKTYEQKREYERSLYHKNREKNLKMMSDYKKRNREKMNLYFKKKNASDKSFNLATRIRVKLNGVFYGKYKDFTSLKHFGCTVTQLFDHIEAQFEPGMNWENRSHNGWHIDHIVPICSFDLTDPDQCSKCWHFTNLRPIWASENRSKNRYGNNPNMKPLSEL